MNSLVDDLSVESNDHRGINMVDLMMWLVIAALILAAALQSIGYYQKATHVFLMKDEVNGVVSTIHASAAIEGTSITDAMIGKAVTDHNAAHSNDDTVISYGTVSSNAAGIPNSNGFELASAVTATSTSTVTYLKAANAAVPDRYVMYFFSPTRTFSQGITTAPKDLVDGAGWNDMAAPAGDPSTASPSPSPTATPIVRTPIDDKYDAVNGPTFLGAPKDVEKDMPTGGGRYRDYANGSIIWSTATGAHTSMNGAIRDKWLALGSETGMGYPTSDDNQPLGTGLQQSYNNNNWFIIKGPDTGAFPSKGGIRARWLASNAQNGILGWPLSDEIGLRDGGVKQIFQGGAVYWSPGNSGWNMTGAPYDEYLKQGAENSILGYPTSNQRNLDATTVRQDFQNGHYLKWNTTTNVVTFY